MVMYALWCRVEKATNFDSVLYRQNTSSFFSYTRLYFVIVFLVLAWCCLYTDLANLPWKTTANRLITWQEFKFDEYQEVKNCYPHGFHGVDRYGRPVYIEQLGLVDLNKFLQVTTVDRFVKHHICEQEKTMNWRFPACSLAAKKHIASSFSILDVKDVVRSHSFQQCLKFSYSLCQ